jgi:hypothetical protein
LIAKQLIDGLAQVLRMGAPFGFVFIRFSWRRLSALPSVTVERPWCLAVRCGFQH